MGDMIARTTLGQCERNVQPSCLYICEEAQGDHSVCEYNESRYSDNKQGRDQALQDNCVHFILSGKHSIV